ncbi:helix-turn-helix domain-containing protein [Aquabacter cavernae]|uniref:helix-turn-helix domain-containing protein n=1 Tax=Aquabacter cavernae TaxID=2496029 RepID=UPI000F8EB2D5|nr:AraC family transcriptional regulator [Aquabacter cavernae]
MRKGDPALHALAFGNRSKVYSKSLVRMQEQVQQMLGWSAEYDALGDPSAFAIQRSAATINGLRLGCIAHTPIRTRVDANELSFFMPIDGAPIKSTVNTEPVRCDVMETALLAPEGERIGTGGHRSVLVAGLDKRRLLETAKVMLAQDEARLDFNRPVSLQLVAGGVNFDLLLRGACKALDACNLSGEAAEKLAIDDVFYRAICGMLLGEKLFGEKEGKRSSVIGDKRLERACEYVMANLSRRITLTDLEVVSGQSARSLQYSFQKQFGCPPLVWIRNERLNAARDLLMTRGAESSVTAVALMFGFSNLGDFSRLYREKFGEYPSETLAATRARQG